MNDLEDLQTENKRLHAEIETYRQQELAELRLALGESRRAVDHFRSEAERNADLGRKISLEAQAQIAELRAKLEALERLYYGRPIRAAGPGD